MFHIFLLLINFTTFASNVSSFNSYSDTTVSSEIPEPITCSSDKDGVCGGVCPLGLQCAELPFGSCMCVSIYTAPPPTDFPQ